MTETFFNPAVMMSLPSPRSKAERLLSNNDWMLNLLSKLVRNPFPVDLASAFANHYCVITGFGSVYPNDMFSSIKISPDHTKVEKHKVWKATRVNNTGLYFYRNILIASTEKIGNHPTIYQLNPEIFPELASKHAQAINEEDFVFFLLTFQAKMAQTDRSSF
jgi:hypothetical protein